MAGEAAAGLIPRPPVLKGLHQAVIKQNIFIAAGLSIVVGIAYKVMINDPKKRDYAEFYKHYDAQASFERMRKLGLFQSCSADD